MLRNKKIKLVFIVLIIFILLFSKVSLATSDIIQPVSENNGQTQESEEEYDDLDDSNSYGEVDTSNWINKDIYVLNENIEINKIVDGNAFVMGDTVRVKGEIGGDLFVIANKLIIENEYIESENTYQPSYIDSNVYALANEIEINGVIMCNLYACADKVIIGEGGYIGRDIISVSNILDISGYVRRNVFATVNEISVSDGSDNGEGDIENTIIQGDLNYTSSKQADIKEGVVGGNIEYTESISEPIQQSAQSVILSYVGDLARALIYGLIIILLALWLAPKFTEKLSKTNTKKIGVSFGIGILSCVIVAFVSILLLVSVLGMPLLVGLLALTGLIVSITKAVVGMAVSGMTMEKLKIHGKVKYVLIALLVIAIIWAIGKIPFGIGLVLKALIQVIGIGLVLTNIVNKKENKMEKVEQTNTNNEN